MKFSLRCTGYNPRINIKLWSAFSVCLPILLIYFAWWDFPLKYHFEFRRAVDSGLTSALQSLSVIDTHLVEVDGDTLSLYGSGALESLDRNWSVQTAGMITTVSFTFIEFDEIVQVLPKLKIKLPNSLVNISFLCFCCCYSFLCSFCSVPPLLGI